MPLITSVRGKKPTIHQNVFIAANASIIGDVCIGSESSIWYNAVLRGDVNKIKIGKRVNIQDGTIIHCTYKKSSTVIANNVTVGHNAILHGCIIQNNVLVGMGAIIMDNAIIESNTIIAAGSIVPAGKLIKSNSIYKGIPAKRFKSLDKIEAEKIIVNSAKNYVMYSSWYKEN
tara:strand:- start:787 stop:1305 length:519 start_codon:yes stop_codon:yes gene_type:complete